MNDDELAGALRTLLSDRAEGVPDTVSLLDVERRSGVLLRRRRGALAAGAVAAAMVVGVIATTAVRDDSSAPAPPGPASTISTTPTGHAFTPPPPFDAAVAEPVRVLEDGLLAEIPLDASPPAYVIGADVVLPDGSRRPLAPLTGSVAYAAVTPLRAGWLTARVKGQALLATVAVVDEDGAPGEDRRGSAALAVSPDGTSVSWWEATTGGGGVLHIQPTTEQTGGAGTELATPDSFLEPLRLRADSSVVVRDGRGRGFVLPGREPVAGIGYLRGAGPDGLVSGDRAGAPPGEYGAVVDGATGEPIWTSDRWGLFGFSADGRYVVGQDSATGGDAGAIATLDARTGEVAAECALLTPERVLGLGDINAARANADGSVDFLAYLGTSEALLRCSPGGAITRLSPSVFAGRLGVIDNLALVRP